MTAASAPPPRHVYRAKDLVGFGKDLLVASGMPEDKSIDIVEILVEGELLGKPTHGYGLLPRYVREIEIGQMTTDGGPTVLHDRGASLSWDARKLPGPWVVLRAMDEAIERARQFGVGAVTFQRSHHLACLGAYLERATAAGYLMMLTLTDAGHSSVAPYGGVTPVLTSNPIAFGAPTGGEPILIDTTTSLQSNGMAALFRERNERLPFPDLMDNQGNATTDPHVLVSTPPGTILPLGGIEHGNKGAGISLMIELLTGCLSGRGRAEPFEGWSAAAFLLVIDPDAFGGREAYLRQTDFLANAYRTSTPRPGFDRVRLPGEGGLARRKRAIEDGVVLPPEVVADLRDQAEARGVAMVEPFVRYAAEF